MTMNYIFTIPYGTKAEIKYEEKRGLIQRRVRVGPVYSRSIVGRRKANFDRRLVSGKLIVLIPDPVERRDPNREMYQYKTSQDSRVRALERRKTISGIKYWAPMKLERRDGFDRRDGSSAPGPMRRRSQRRKP